MGKRDGLMLCLEGKKNTWSKKKETFGVDFGEWKFYVLGMKKRMMALGLFLGGMVFADDAKEIGLGEWWKIYTGAGSFMLKIVCQNRGEFLEGEPILIQPIFVNQKETPVIVWMSSFAVNHRIVLKDENGDAPEMTDKGKEWAKRFGDLERQRNVPLSILPGDVAPLSSKFDLLEFFKLKTGKYYIAVIYEDYQCIGFSGIVCSNELTIEVVKGKKTPLEKFETGTRVDKYLEYLPASR